MKCRDVIEACKLADEGNRKTWLSALAARGLSLPNADPYQVYSLRGEWYIDRVWGVEQEKVVKFPLARFPL